MKVKIFIDFWNLQISWNEYHKARGAIKVSIPWGPKLTNSLLSKLGADCEYVGTHIYASVNPNNPADKRLKSFLNYLDTLEGYKVIVKDRKPSKSVFCNNCQFEIKTCPECKEPLKRTIEKGVDTSIAIELFQFAIDNVYDKALLVSGDADFIPAIDYIQQRGKYIIHAGWESKSYHLSKACWNHFFFEDLMAELLT